MTVKLAQYSINAIAIVLSIILYVAVASRIRSWKERNVPVYAGDYGLQILAGLTFIGVVCLSVYVWLQ